MGMLSGWWCDGKVEQPRLRLGGRALMMDMDDIILDRISFGGVKELREIYSD